MISLNFDRWLGLARRHPFCSAAAAISVIFGLTSVGLLRYQYSLTLLQHKRQAEGEAVLATLLSGPQLRQEIANVHEATNRIEANLVSSNLGENAQYFYRMEELTKIYLDDFHGLNAPVTNNPTYDRVPFVLRASGNYQQLVAFIYTIETGPRLANITYFGLRRRGGNNPTLTLEMNLELLGKK